MRRGSEVNMPPQIAIFYKAVTTIKNKFNIFWQILIYWNVVKHKPSENESFNGSRLY